MAAIDHWHPVLLSRDLCRKPVGIRLHGREIVLFRGPAGEVGALEDICPHRRMRLSLGSIVNDRLQCKYHGWTYDCAGNGESPGTPKLHAQAASYDAVDRHGAIWVKPRDAQAELPNLDFEGYFHMGNLYHRAKAPLEVTVDNFCEIEHTPTTHAFFGYPLERMPEVRVEFQTTDTTVRVINWGPPKKISWLLRFLLGIKKGYEFRDDWTTYFSPVYSVYDHWFECPTTGKTGRVHWKLPIFFTPISADETAIITFVYTKSRYFGPAGGARLFRPFMMRQLNYEVQLDVNILEGLADKSASLEGMKLSRFDKALGLNRERIERVYRGRSIDVNGPLASVERV
jgi:phenylpropionate dioxygenase-like ring-hydroxylating dioxygenase large terminal subunit